MFEKDKVRGGYGHLPTIEEIQRMSLYINYLVPQYKLCKTIEECEETMHQITKLYQYDENHETKNTIITNIKNKAKELSETTALSYEEALGQVCKEYLENN